MDKSHVVKVKQWTQQEYIVALVHQSCGKIHSQFSQHA
jgi:hypothetical protein